MRPQIANLGKKSKIFIVLLFLKNTFSLRTFCENDPKYPNKVLSNCSSLSCDVHSQKKEKNIFCKNTCGGNGILLPKLFLPTVKKDCSSDREKLLKFEAEG